MKRASNDALLEELIRAARADAPPAAFLEEAQALALLGKGSPDGTASLASTKSSLSAAFGTGQVGTGLWGVSGVLKSGAGIISVAMVAAGGAALALSLFGSEGRLGDAAQGGEHVRASAERQLPSGLVSADDRAAGPKADAQEQATLPLPPVFDAAATTVPTKGPVSMDPASRRSVEQPASKARGPVNPDQRSQRFLAEARLVDAARRALRNDAGEALRLTEQCAREFPNGIAATERSVIAIEALVRLGREEDARARLASFERIHPNSFHLPFLKRLLLQESAGD